MCNADDCFDYLGADKPFYTQLNDAIENVVGSGNFTGPFTFYLVPGSHSIQTHIPLTNASISIFGMLPFNSSTPMASIGGITSIEAQAPQLLRLSDLNIGILSLSADTPVTLMTENVNLTEYVSIEGGPSSNVTLIHAFVTVPVWVSLLAESSFVMTDSSLESINISPKGSTFVKILSNRFLKASSLVLSPGSSLVMSYNLFQQGMRVLAYNSSMLISKNEFRAPEKHLNFDQSWLPNLLLEVRCSIWFWIDENVFYNGTFQISDNSKVVGTSAEDEPFSDVLGRLSARSQAASNFPYATHQPHNGRNTSNPSTGDRHEHRCTVDLGFHSSLKFNRFISEERRFRVYDLLDKPAEPRLVFLKGLDVGPLRMAESMGSLLDATQNWWGDASGPYLCCNPNGNGSYTSLSVNVSDWCTSPACAAYSKVELPSHCLKSGCSQKLDRTELIIYATTAMIALLLLIVSIVFSLYHNIRYFNVTSFEKYSREHLLPKAHIQWRVGLGCASIGAVLAIANVSVLIASTMHTSAHAHQHIIPFRGFVILWIYFCLAVFQLFLTIAGFFLSFVGTRQVGWLIKPLYSWTLLNVIVTIVIAIDWLPTAGFVDLLAHFFITESSHLMNLIYLCSVLLCLVSIAAFIPVRLMNQLLNHSELARISAALEVALLKELMHSPTVEIKAKYLRISSATSLIIGIFPMAAVLYDLTIDSYFRTRLWLSAVQHGLGLLCVIAIFIASFYYNQRLLTTLLSLLLATVTVGCIQDTIFWSYYLSVAVESIYSQGFVVFQIAASVVWTLSLIAQHIFVYLLNHSVSSELPKMAVENLNNLMDRNVLDQISFSPERIPLLMTESDTSRNSSIQHESEHAESPYDSYSS